MLQEEAQELEERTSLYYMFLLILACLPGSPFPVSLRTGALMNPV